MRRLRTMLEAILEADGINVVRWTADVGPDGLGMTITFPDPDREVEVCARMVELAWRTAEMVAGAFAGLIHEHHPRTFKRRWPEAVDLVNAALDTMQARRRAEAVGEAPAEGTS